MAAPNPIRPTRLSADIWLGDSLDLRVGANTNMAVLHVATERFGDDVLCLYTGAHTSFETDKARRLADLLALQEFGAAVSRTVAAVIAREYPGSIDPADYEPAALAMAEGVTA